MFTELYFLFFPKLFLSSTFRSQRLPNYFTATRTAEYIVGVWEDLWYQRAKHRLPGKSETCFILLLKQQGAEGSLYANNSSECEWMNEIYRLTISVANRMKESIFLWCWFVFVCESRHHRHIQLIHVHPFLDCACSHDILLITSGPDRIKGQLIHEVRHQSTLFYSKAHF